MKPLYCTKGHENQTGTRFCQQCGEKLVPAGSGINPGSVLGDRYRVDRLLGHGGFGRTYLAFDLNRFNEPCVLKEFAPKIQEPYALQKAEELFEREAGVLYALQHPQIPRFRELFRVDREGKGRLLLVQDYVQGQTYRALLDARKRQGMRFAEAEATQLLLQLLPVLQYIHSLRVIHRDISPDNMILRSSDGLPILIDFGGVKQVAATVESQLTQPGGNDGTAPLPTRLGKVGYAPAEQLQRGVVAPHSDLYALAATVLVLLTGKEPGELMENETLSWNWQREVSLSPTLGAMLDKMLSYWPGDRYQTASGVLRDLTATTGRMPVPPPPVLPTEATRAVAPVPEIDETPVPSRASGGLSGGLGKTLFVTLLILGAGGVGWLGGNLWLSTQPKPRPTPIETTPPTTTPPTTTPPSLSAQEQQRKAALRQRRTALGIEENFYAELVNEAFWTQNPSQRGRRPGNGPEDEQLRSQWERVAVELLSKIEQANLSQESRSKLGRFEKADRDRFKVEANQLRVGSRTLNDLADAAFFYIFPQQRRGEDFIDKPIGQVWQAIASDKLKALQSGTALGTIRFEPGATNKKVSGTLKPGEGRAYIAQLRAEQLMDLKLTGGKESLLSLYSPSGKKPILEDSRDRAWAGTLPESGFYEFVVVNIASAAIDYQLDLTVSNPPSTPSPQPSDSDTASPPQSQQSPQ